MRRRHLRRVAREDLLELALAVGGQSEGHREWGLSYGKPEARERERRREEVRALRELLPRASRVSSPVNGPEPSGVRGRVSRTGACPRAPIARRARAAKACLRASMRRAKLPAACVSIAKSDLCCDVARRRVRSARGARALVRWRRARRIDPREVVECSVRTVAPKTRKRVAGLQQVQLQPEGGRRAEVQGHDADDESARSRDPRSPRRSRAGPGPRRAGRSGQVRRRRAPSASRPPRTS